MRNKKRELKTLLLREVFPTLVHYCIHYVYTIIMLIPVIILSLLRLDTLNRILLKFWAHSLFWSMGRRLHIKNKEYIEQGKSYIAVMNHTSYLDIPAVMTVIPGGAWVGREKMLHLPLFNIMLRRLKYIPIEPSSWRKSLQAISLASERSSEGLVILMFPEGTRTDDGHISEFRKGFIRILRESGTDVLPITINGLYFWKSKYQKHINTTEQLEIVIGRPLEADKLLELTDSEIALKVKDAVESEYRYTKKAEE